MNPATLDPTPVRRARAESDRAQGEAFTLPEPAREPSPRRASEEKASPRADEARKPEETRRPEVAQRAEETRERDESAPPAKAEASDAQPAEKPAKTDEIAEGEAPPKVGPAAGAPTSYPAARSAVAAEPGIAISESLVETALAAAADPILEAPAEGTQTTKGEEPRQETGASDKTAVAAAEPQAVPAASPQATPLLDAAILLAAAAPTVASKAAAASQAGEASPQPATLKPALASISTPPPGLARAGDASVAVAAGEAGGQEATADMTFGAIVSAAAKAKEPHDIGKPAHAEGKAAEAPQAQQGPIDLSFLSQGRAARPETAIVLPASAEAAQGQAAGPQTQSGGPATPIHVVPLEIGLQALAGSKRFDIRLDPAELGRVDVNLEISDTGEVTAKLIVDRVETLHLLQRDARTLERAFEQAGLKPSDAGVDITLRDPSDQSGFRQNRQDGEAPRRGRPSADKDDGGDIAITAQPAPARRLLRLGGVDLSV